MTAQAVRPFFQALLLIASGFLLTLVVLPAKERLWGDAVLVAANVAPVIIIIVLFLAVCGRFFAAIGITALLLGMLRYIHDSKIEVLESPLLSGDAQLLSQIFLSPDMALEYMSGPGIAGILGLIVLTGMLFIFENPVACVRYRFCALALLLLALLPLRSAIANHYKELPDKPWDINHSLHGLGIVAYLIRDYLVMGDLDTPEADREVVDAARSQFRLQQTPNSGANPDVVFWLSESFFDPRIFREIQSCQHTPTFCQLAADNISGSITVPTFGGQTIRTEFELLTGVPMSTVKKHHFPYMSLTNVPVNSVAWELRSQGYETVALHNHKRGFWRRPVALKNLGFQRWLGVEDMETARRVGNFHADDVLTDSVVEVLEQTADDVPQLIFAISMQAHGPYGKQPRLPNEQVTAIAVPTQLRAKNIRVLQEYLFHLNAADTELQRLVEYVQSRDRSTMVLFLGDHLPGLGGVYRDLVFENKRGPKEQKTPYVIFSNFPLQHIAKEHSVLAAWQLSTLTLRAGGLLGSGAFAWFDLLYGELGWPAATTAECSDAACNTLLQFQYRQLAGPNPGY